MLAQRQGAARRRAGSDVRRARRAPRPRTSRRRSRSSTRSCPRSWTWSARDKQPPPLVHEEWGDNVVPRDARRRRARRDPRESAADRVRRRICAPRGSAMSPLEGRGVLGEWNEPARPARDGAARRRCRTSTAPGFPSASASTRGAIRVDRAGRRRRLRLQGDPAARRRSVSRWLARKLGRPVRWLEDRREQLTANANCREHDYDITALRGPRRAAARDRLRGHGRFGRLFAPIRSPRAWKPRR